MLLFRRLCAERPIVYPSDPALNNPSRDEFPKGDKGTIKFNAAHKRWMESWESYTKNYNLDDLMLRKGMKPTVIWIRGLTESQTSAVQTMLEAGAKVSEAIAYSVVRVENCMVPGADGEPTPVSVSHEPSELGDRLTKESMQLFTDNTFRMYLWAEVGRAGELAPAHTKSNSAPAVDT